MINTTTFIYDFIEDFNLRLEIYNKLNKIYKEKYNNSIDKFKFKGYTINIVKLSDTSYDFRYPDLLFKQIRNEKENKK